MINNYKDHAANERTYLAWIRTAVALMAFGFVIEKFNLFLQYMSTVTKLNTPTLPGIHAENAGMLLIIVGLLITGISTWNFLRNRRLIDSENHLIYRGTWSTVALGGIVALMGLFLVFYLIRESL